MTVERMQMLKAFLFFFHPPMAHQDHTVDVCWCLRNLEDCHLERLNFEFGIIVFEVALYPFIVQGLEIVALPALLQELGHEVSGLTFSNVRRLICSNMRLWWLSWLNFLHTILAEYKSWKERESTFVSISKRSLSIRDSMKIRVVVYFFITLAFFIVLPFFIVLQLDEVVCALTSMNKYTTSLATQKSFMHNSQTIN